MITSEFLVPLEGNQADDALLSASLMLADQVNARVSCIYAQIDPIETFAVPMDGGLGVGSASLVEAACTGNDEAWANQQKRVLEMAKTQPRLSIERLIGHREFDLSARSALADVAIFSCESARGKTGISTLFTALLMDARSPVLILRDATRQKPVTMAIAWDGGLEAARAVKAAHLFLKAAGEVIIIQSGEPTSEMQAVHKDLNRLQDWLGRHEINAKVHTLTASGDTGEAIVSACATLGVDMLVCGAYGHSPVQEFIFGGVTRTLIKTTSSPSLFMAH